VDGQTATLIATVGGFAVALAAFMAGALARVENRTNARMDRFEARMEARMDRLDDRMDRVEQRLSRVEHEVAELSGRVGVLSELTQRVLTQRAA
jgi:TolA-binding protein